MYMTADEIRRRHKNAENPKKHVSILAELNGCGVEEIREILFGRGGEEVNLKIDYDKAKELYDQGLSDRAIANELGLKSGSSILRWRTENGIPANFRAGG